MHYSKVNDSLNLVTKASVSDQSDTSHNPPKTEILYKPEEVLKRSLQELSNAKETVDSCVEEAGPSHILKVEVLLRVTKDGVARGVRYRYVTEITKKNLSDCKELMKIVQLRHMDGIKGNFNIADRRIYGGGGGNDTAEGKFPSQYIFSNVPAFVQQQQYFFEMLWDKAIAAEQRIKQIEEQWEPEFLEVINDGKRAVEMIVELANSVKKEALLLLPVAASVVRMEKLGIWDDIIVAADRGATVRIICPINSANEIIVKKMQAHNISIQNGEPSSAGFIVVDNQKYMRADSRHPDALDLSNSIGFLEYSNSTSGISSFKTLFDIIWRQNLSYQELHNFSEMQNEFISVAAHELRNPVQPILGLAQVLLEKASDEDRPLLEVIVRNARKLAEIQDNLLDVTRIESNNLRIRKERVNLKDLIRDVTFAFRGQLSKEVDIILNVSDISVDIDASRISQVLSNLLNNAAKFTTKGSIVVSLNELGKEVTIKVHDSGPGINQEVLPKLFSKFFTTTAKGTGLGLFISKGIVQAHGGRIWAENKTNEKGATFAFSLPC